MGHWETLKTQNIIAIHKNKCRNKQTKKLITETYFYISGKPKNSQRNNSNMYIIKIIQTTS